MAGVERKLAATLVPRPHTEPETSVGVRIFAATLALHAYHTFVQSRRYI